MRTHEKRPIRQILPVLHIFCEGSASEPNYLKRYKTLFCKEKASIAIEPTDKTTPVQLVEEAIRLKESPLVGKGDEFWVVYDRESPQKYDEKFHAAARIKAKMHGINIALSNVCFEVWLLLHFQPTCAACDSCDELTRRKDFKLHFPDYEKGSPCLFTSDQINEARKNAKKLNERTRSGANRSWNVPSKWNPYTDVYKLLDAIDEFQEHKLL